MIVTLAIIALFGVLLVILETFVPGGIAGFLGGAFILTASLIALFAEEFADWSQLQRTILAVTILILSSLACIIWLRFFAVKFFHRAFTLEAQSGSTSLLLTPPEGGKARRSQSCVR